jgi:tetratricopeptide (TPR) repeat protein
MWLLDFGSDRKYLEAIGLSREGKRRHSPYPGPADPTRRNFLLRFCQGASAAFLPTGLLRGSFGFHTPFAVRATPPADAEFHLHPHYRGHLSLEATLRKTAPGLDEFVAEKYAEQIATILQKWSLGLRQSPLDLQAITDTLSPDFSGFSFRPPESRLVRPGPSLQVHENKFPSGIVRDRRIWLQELHDSLSPFSNIEAAEFHVISIDDDPGAAEIKNDSPTGGEGGNPAELHLKTLVHYELVGSGREFHREQRIGEWELEWARNSAGEFRLKKWQTVSERQCRAVSPIFAEITEQALGGTESYSAQLLHGADYWRTLLDGACGIDIYGHNGVSVGDIDDDGFEDLYICQPAGLPNRLYRNRGDGTFEDITDASGVGLLENTACALFADIDNDGRQDLIVVRTNGPLLFLNQGGGKFELKPGAFQFANPPQGTFTGAALADYDRDGWLDIYLCQYIYYQGAEQYKYPSPYFDAENGPPNFMMRNNRDGTFRDVTAETGLNENNTRYTFCCGWNDHNRDGWPDLYVVNDFGRKNLYRNNGDGTFTDVAPQAGVEDVGAGMSVCWFDYDNDGIDDLYVADMWTAAGLRVSAQDIFQKDAPKQARALYRKHAMGNSLFRGRADGTFADASTSAAVQMGRWAWSSDSWDFDHDGFPDLYISNGMVSGPTQQDLNSFFWRQVVAKSPNESRPAPAYEQGWSALNELIRSDSTWSGYERNVFYANNRDGTFSDVSGVVDMDFLEDGRSFALADFDHDGRLEVFLKNRNGPQLRLMKNVMEDLPPSISFRLRGTRSNRDAIGAVITVETEKGRQTRTLQAGSGFLSQHTKEFFFGLGDVKGPVRASIRWPSGLTQQLEDLPVNHRIWVEEGGAPTRMEAFKSVLAPIAQGRKLESPRRLPGSDTTLYRNKMRSEAEIIPATVETWLVAPVSAPDFSLPDVSGQTRTLSELRGKSTLLSFWVSDSPASRANLEIFSEFSRWTAQGLQLLTVNVDDAKDAAKLATVLGGRHFSFPIVRGSDDVAGIYNVLVRYLFDRHRDMTLPVSFLIDAGGEIVKIYQGALNPEHVAQDFTHIPRTAAARMERALPFHGVIDDPEFRRNYLSLGSVFFQREYFDQAEAWLRLALRDDPHSAEALYGLGSIYLKKEKTAEARETFERALTLRAGYPDTLPNAWNNLGLLATREGRTDQAIEYFQKALQLSPDHLVALENLGNAYRQQKRWDEARTTLLRATEVGPEDAEANYSLGMVFAQTDDTDRAYEYLQRALRFRPGYPEALNNLGVLYLRTRQRDQAVASFEECIRVAPEFEQSYLNLARVYALEGTPEKARAVLLDLLKQHPGNAHATSMLESLPK